MKILVVILLLAGAAHAQSASGSGSGSGSASGSDDGDFTDADLGTGDATPSVEESGDTGTPTTGDARLGIYSDSDHTQVIRTLAEVAHAFGPFSMNASAGVDAVTSASIDVRTSPLANPDTVTGASGRTTTEAGKMTDRRIQATLGGGWNDGSGHQLGASATVANEHDYGSVAGALNGSYDLRNRQTTLLGGVTYTDNRISSVLDDTLHETSHAYGWSTGLAEVVTRDDAVRVRYDGTYEHGYIASPYRNVRFGDWTTTTSSTGQITFANTIGSADGLPERLPTSRVGHALVLEEVHALTGSVGLHPEVRLAHESWGIDSLTAELDLRVAQAGWRMELGYRYYQQSRADFYRTKYTMDPSQYTYYTSDKELGAEDGHAVTLDVFGVLREPADEHHSRLLLDGRIAAMYYRYPGFELMSSRMGWFGQIGLTWEP